MKLLPPYSKFELRAQSFVARVSLPRWKRVASDLTDSTGLPSGLAGAFVYDTYNIGDEIQTIAALQCIPSPSTVVPINRDQLSRDRSNYDGRIVVLPMNGWHTHRPDAWPPKPEIVPIFEGFHLKDELILRNSEVVDYLRRHEPIGCRDSHTSELLNRFSIRAEFRGCPTLALARNVTERSDRILIVDAGGTNPDAHTSNTQSLLASVPSWIIERSTLLTQNVSIYSRRRYAYKLQQAMKRLEALASAKLVITSRLHVALPCLAFGTPCVLMHESPEDEVRIKDYLPYLHHSSTSRPLRIFDWENPVAKPFPARFSFLKEEYRLKISTALQASLPRVSTSDTEEGELSKRLSESERMP